MMRLSGQRSCNAVATAKRFPESNAATVGTLPYLPTVAAVAYPSAIAITGEFPGFLTPVGCHTWRATGITIYLENDGRLEHAQQMAGHESPRTTKLYDRTKDEITLSEVERIRL